MKYGLAAVGVLLVALLGYGAYAAYPRFDLPAVEGPSLLLLAAAAGAASVFSPCVFSLLVALFAREGADGLLRSLSNAATLAAGAALFVILAGGALALGAGAAFAEVTFDSTAGRAIRGGVAVILLGLGLIQAEALPNPFHAVEPLHEGIRRVEARVGEVSTSLRFFVMGFAYLVAGFG